MTILSSLNASALPARLAMDLTPVGVAKDVDDHVSTV